MKRIIIVCLLLWWNIALASVTIKLDPPTISMNETVRITLSYDNTQNHGIPDLTPLLRDFDVLSTERSFSYTAINGQARSISQWSLVLKPKRTGIIPIPPIRIGQEQSLPSQVTVTNQTPPKTPSAPNESLANSGSTRLTAEVNETKPYVNQQALYTVKLLNQQRLLDAQYQPPQVEDALLIPLGEGRHYQTQLKGETYDVEEQQYAIFPQRKGELRILPPSFDALTYDGIEPKRINLQAKSITLTVEPLPLNQTINNWLPSNQVNLTETYDQTDSTIQEGRTLIRTIKIQAAGLVAQLLPTPTFHHGKRYNAYPDKPTTQNELRQGELWGNATLQVTYLLTKPGQVTLPAIRIPWYNTNTKQSEIASLPARTLNVTPKPGSAVRVTTPKQPNVSHTARPKISKVAYSKAIWIGIPVLFLFILVWLRWRRFRSKATPTQGPNHSPQSELHDACKSNDPGRVRIALIVWAQNQWPNQSILNLNDIPVHNEAFQKQLKELSSVLYGPPGKTQWKGHDLWLNIASSKTEALKQKKKKTKLPPIYPEVS
ncbi:MAG: BatD family protein [Legionellaceae bacterium]|nr:BatD family protein [Legionellaceae bacterium]